MIGYVSLAGFLFLLSERLGIGTLDLWVLRVGIKVLDVTGTLAVPLSAAEGDVTLRGFKLRQFSEGEFLIRPVAFFENAPSAAPLATGIARLSRRDRAWRLQAYCPAGFPVFFGTLALLTFWGWSPGWAVVSVLAALATWAMDRSSIRSVFRKLITEGQDGG